MKLYFTTAFFMILIFSSVLSQTNTWTGATDTDWHKSCNWSLNTIPVCTDSVVIPTVTNYPVVTGIAHCLYLNITSSAADALTINSAGGGNLDVSYGGGSCSGTITDNGGCAYSQMCASQAGISNLVDVAYNADGSYVVAGYTFTYGQGGNDGIILKIDGNGANVWTRTIGGPLSEIMQGITKTSDGGYALVGVTTSYVLGGLRDLYVVKFDGAGTLQWAKNHSANLGGSYDSGKSIIEASDGSLVACGFATGTSFIIKMDNTGSALWWRTMNSGEGRGITETSDGGFVMAGVTTVYGQGGGGDAYVVKVDANGNLLWTATVGGASGYDYGVGGIVEASDGSVVVVGATGSYGQGNNDLYAFKLNSTGTSLLWTLTVGGTANDGGVCIVETPDGGFVIGGSTASFGTSAGYLVKTNSSGIVQWTRTVNNALSYNSIAQTTDGGFIAMGQIGAITKLDGSGTSSTCCTQGTGGISGTGGILSSGGTISVATVTSGTNGVVGSTGGVTTVSCGN